MTESSPKAPRHVLRLHGVQSKLKLSMRSRHAQVSRSESMAIVCLPANGSKQKGSGNRLLWPRRSPLASSRDEMLLGASSVPRFKSASGCCPTTWRSTHLRCREKSAKNFNKLLIAFKWCSEKKEIKQPTHAAWRQSPVSGHHVLAANGSRAKGSGNRLLWPRQWRRESPCSRSCASETKDINCALLGISM